MCLDWRDTEKSSVELVDSIEVGTEPAGLALNRGIRKEFTHTPGAGSGNTFDNGVPAGFEQTPEGRQVPRAGEPACHAHDGDRLSGPDFLSSSALMVGGQNFVTVRGESPASTETGPAPAGQGAMREHTGSM